jgi:hypothetical protein
MRLELVQLPFDDNVFPTSRFKIAEVQMQISITLCTESLQIKEENYIRSIKKLQTDLIINLSTTMKRLSYTILILIIAPAWVNAQSGSSTVFSLDQCIAHALENTVDIKNARVDEQIAKARVKELVGVGLPQVARRLA